MQVEPDSGVGKMARACVVGTTCGRVEVWERQLAWVHGTSTSAVRISGWGRRQCRRAVFTPEQLVPGPRQRSPRRESAPGITDAPRPKCPGRTRPQVRCSTFTYTLRHFPRPPLPTSPCPNLAPACLTNESQLLGEPQAFLFAQPYSPLRISGQPDPNQLNGMGCLGKESPRH